MINEKLNSANAYIIVGEQTLYLENTFQDLYNILENASDNEYIKLNLSLDGIDATPIFIRKDAIQNFGRW